jgi:hypothetical protein
MLDDQYDNLQLFTKQVSLSTRYLIMKEDINQAYSFNSMNIWMLMKLLV